MASRWRSLLIAPHFSRMFFVVIGDSARSLLLIALNSAPPSSLIGLRVSIASSPDSMGLFWVSHLHARTRVFYFVHAPFLHQVGSSTAENCLLISWRVPTSSRTTSTGLRSKGVRRGCPSLLQPPVNRLEFLTSNILKLMCMAFG